MVTVPIIGLLYSTPADTEATPEPLAGWHINTTEPVAGWEAFAVTPTAPRVTFPVGVPTVFYSFPDEPAAAQALTVAGLLPETNP